MLQNSRVTAFTIFELSRENHMGGEIILPTQIRVKIEIPTPIEITLA